MSPKLDIYLGVSIVQSIGQLFFLHTLEFCETKPLKGKNIKIDYSTEKLQPINKLPIE